MPKWLFSVTPPVGVDHRGALLVGADAVLPVVFVREATTRPAQQGDLDALEGGDDIVADAAGVGDRAILADPHAFVNAVAEVLRELAVDVAVDGVLPLVGMDHEPA